MWPPDSKNWLIGKNPDAGKDWRQDRATELNWCWTWISKTMATWWEELTHWKRHWCWERLKAGGEEGDRGQDGWMASAIQWTWVWANSGRQWRTGKPGVVQSMGSGRAGHRLVTEQQNIFYLLFSFPYHSPLVLLWWKQHLYFKIWVDVFCYLFVYCFFPHLTKKHTFCSRRGPSLFKIPNLRNLGASSYHSILWMSAH